MRTAGRIRPAAHPQMELTITSAVPGCAFKAWSTESDVRSSSMPRRVNSSRMGITIISGYIDGYSFSFRDTFILTQMESLRAALLQRFLRRARVVSREPELQRGLQTGVSLPRLVGLRISHAQMKMKFGNPRISCDCGFENWHRGTV